ncbi:DNA cytosine methyltransferase [Cupriavidus basilensis]
MKTFAVTSLQQNRNRPRIWLQGSRLAAVGFAPAQRYSVEEDDAARRITLRLSAQGERGVVGKSRGEKIDPVIDLNSASMLSMYEGMQTLRVIYDDGVVHIMPLATEARKAERIARVKAKLAAGEPLSTGSVSTGVGALLLATHDGLADAGVESKLAFAVEIESDYIEQCERANPAWSADAVMVAAPLQEIAFDAWAVRRLPTCDLLEAGLPCTAASVAGRAKKGLSMPEADPNVGHLVVGFLAIVAATNPLAITVENVVPYMNTASFAILRNQLTEWGYHVQADVLKSEDFNCIEHRDRMALVAVTAGIDFDFAAIERPAPQVRRLAEILEPIPDDSPLYSEMSGLKAKQARDLENGKNFKMQTYSADATHIGTLTKGYSKVRSTDPKVCHPTNPDLLRQLTPTEHAAAKQIPPALIEGMSNTRAHEVLGQSILIRPFRALAKALGAALKQWAVPQEAAPFMLLAA